MVAQLAALAGLGAVNAGGNLVGAYLSSRQARKQQRAYNDIYTQQQQFLQQQQGLLNPFTQAGTSALSPLTALLTGGDMGAFQASPSYQFRLNEGIDALNRVAAARGQLFSGNQAKEAQRYASDLASQEYGNYINQLMGLGNLGLSAANSQASLGMNAAPMLSQLSLGGAYNPFDWGAAISKTTSSLTSPLTFGIGASMSGGKFGGLGGTMGGNY
jgi:hypothetical protein